MEITTSQAVATMQKYGGNGMQKLAACWLALDSDKRMRLEMAFNAEFASYREIAEQENKYREGLRAA